MHESASEIEGASAVNFEPGSVPRYVDDVSPGLEIAAGLFFSDPDGAPLSSCLFSMNHAHLSEALFMHGLPDSGLGLVQCQQSLIFHLISGHCALNLTSSVATVLDAPLRERPSCRMVSLNDGAMSISLHILDRIINAPAIELSISCLKTICKAINMDLSGTTSSGLRRKLVRFLRDKRSDLEAQADHQSLSIPRFFDRVESMKRPSLV